MISRCFARAGSVAGNILREKRIFLATESRRPHSVMPGVCWDSGRAGSLSPFLRLVLGQGIDI